MPWSARIITDIFHHIKRNKATYGNWRYVLRYFILYFVIGTILEIGASISEHPKLLNLSHSISKLIYVFIMFLIVVFGGYLIVRTPIFKDTYFVRKELKYLLYLYLFVVTSYTLMTVLSSDKIPIFEEIATTILTIANFGMFLFLSN